MCCDNGTTTTTFTFTMPQCQHDLAFDEHCDLVYCRKCNETWKNGGVTVMPFVYPQPLQPSYFYTCNCNC